MVTAGVPRFLILSSRHADYLQSFLLYLISIVATIPQANTATPAQPQRVSWNDNSTPAIRIPTASLPIRLPA